MSIFKKMALISAEIETVSKNLKVGYGTNTYKAVAENDIIAAVKPLEAKHNVYSYPIARVVLESQIIEGEKSDKMFMRIQTTYRFTDIEDLSFIDVVSFGDGVDTQDKAPGKAMTYADKYALMKAYKIPTGDDPDKDASESFKKKEYIEKKSSEAPINEAHIRLLKELTKDIEPDVLKATLRTRYKVETIESLSHSQSADMLSRIQLKKETNDGQQEN